MQQIYKQFSPWRQKQGSSFQNKEAEAEEEEEKKRGQNM